MTVRFGILGSAKIARSTIKAIDEAAGAEAVAVGSRSLEKAKTYAVETGLSHAYGSYDELINSNEIDAVYVALPIHMHKEWTIKALEAGKAVLCEKSLCLNTDDAIEMYNVAKEKGLLLREVMAYRFHPLAAKTKELIAAGKIGDVKIIHADFHTPTFEKDNIRMQKECGGGALRDLGVYCIDANRLFFDANPIHIKAHQVIGETEVDMQTFGILEFEQGIGYFSCSLGTTFDCHFEITGTNGRIRCSRGAMVAWGGEEFKIDLASGDENEEIIIPACNPYQKMIESFVQAMNCGEVQDPLHNNSVGNMQVIDAIVEQQLAVSKG